jgi:hypothetical protein
MFMTFIGCDSYGVPNNTKFCINMKTISSITELGQWVAVPPQPSVVVEQYDLSRAPRISTRPTSMSDIFQPIPNALMLQSDMHGNNYQVIGNFDIVSEALSNISSSWE